MAGVRPFPKLDLEAGDRFMLEAKLLASGPKSEVATNPAG